MKINKKFGFIIAICIIVFGISLIYFNVRSENIKVAKDRSNYYIISDVNKNDILKIEKKIFDISNIKQILISKKDGTNVYRIDDKNLISDVISGFSFEKFVYNENAIIENEDWFVEVGIGSKFISFAFSNDSNVVKLNYNDKDFMVEVNEEFYNFMYKLFESLES